MPHKGTYKVILFSYNSYPTIKKNFLSTHPTSSHPSGLGRRRYITKCPRNKSCKGLLPRFWLIQFRLYWFEWWARVTDPNNSLSVQCLVLDLIMDLTYIITFYTNTLLEKYLQGDKITFLILQAVFLHKKVLLAALLQNPLILIILLTPTTVS